MDVRRRFPRVLEDPEHVEPPFVDECRTKEGEDDSAEDAVLRAEQEARDKGYREGRERAVEEAAVEIEKLRRETTTALKRLVELEDSLVKRHEAALLEITIEAASRIVRQRLDQGDPVAVRALEEALKTLPDSAAIRARVHPDDLQPVGEALRAEVESGRVELIADPAVARGGAIAERDAGRVDATLETAEASVRAAILGAEENR